MKRLINIIVVILLSQLFMAVNARTTNKVVIDGLTYQIEEDSGVYDRIGVCRPESGVYNLSEVVIPDFVEYAGRKLRVEYIFNQAFEGCQSLQKVVCMGDSINILHDAFAGSGLKEIVFPQKYTYLDLCCFERCKSLKNIVFNSAYTEIWARDQGGPFVSGSYFSIYELPFENIAFLGDSYMIGPNLLATNASATNAALAYDINSCYVPEGYVIPEEIIIDWGDGVHIVDEFGLGWYNAKKITLPGNVHLLSHIGCPFLSEVEIGANIEHDTDESYNYGIGYYSFSNPLRFVICHDLTPRPISPYTFNLSADGFPDTALYVHASALEVYKNHEVWGMFKTILPIELGVGDIEINSASGEDTPAQYYNLQGVRVKEPASGQIVITKKGGKVTKMIF